MNYGFLAVLTFSVSCLRQFSCLICATEQKGAVGRDLGRCQHPMAMEIEKSIPMNWAPRMGIHKSNKGDMMCSENKMFDKL